jgi:hypothetical protein
MKQKKVPGEEKNPFPKEGKGKPITSVLHLYYLLF